MLTIYGKTGCTYCIQAKNHLEKMGIEFIEKLLDKDFTRDSFLSIYPDAKTFPHIVEEDGTVVGGYTQLINNEKYKVKNGSNT